MFKVSAWNEYKIDGTGKLVVRHEVEASDLTSALNVAEKLARKWNNHHRATDKREWRVNMLSCNGHVRAVL